MNFESPAVRKILDGIRQNPTDSAHWHDLLITCFDQKDSESFETYQIVADAVNQLVQAQKLATANRRTVRVLLNSRQKEAFLRLSQHPLDIDAITEVGKVLLEDFSRASDAKKLFERALRLAPTDADLVRWIERCGHPPTERAPAAEEIAAQDAPSGPVPGASSRADVRRMMRMTYHVTPRLLGPASSTPPTDSVPAPAPIAPAAASVPEADFARAFDAVLDAINAEDLDALTHALPNLEKHATTPSSRGLAFTLAARTFHQLGRHDAALSAYQRALQALPEVASLHFAQASVYHELGRIEDAKNVYRGVISRFPNHDRAWSNLGAIHYQLDEYPEAEACFRRALEINPASPTLWNDFTTVLMERGDYTRALQAVDELIQRDPSHAEAWLKRGMILLEQNDLSGARDAIQRQLAAHGASPLALATMAIIQARSGKASEAYQICREMGTDPSVAAALSNAWLETALAFEQNDDFPRALECLKQSLELDAGQTMAWVRLGLICRRNGALDEAETALERATKTDPTEVRAWSELGLTRYQMGRHAEAAEAFDKAAALSPTSADWSYNAGVAWEKAGHPERAALSYERAVNIQPDHVSAHINLGLVYVQLGQHEKAASCLQGLLLVRDDYARGWFALGLVYEEIQRWDEAAHSLERALEIDPTLPEVWPHLAYVYRKLGRDDEARAALLKASPATPAPAAPAATHT
jgi:tetratricopeptide (TPR) repeat protein